MAENLNLSFYGFSVYRYDAAGMFFPGYASVTVYECARTYDDVIYDGNT